MKNPGALHPYFRATPRASHAGGSWTVPALCAAYDWPLHSNPGGGIIGIVELGGGWIKSDMASFFDGIGQPMPSIVDISVDGTENTPTPGDNSPDYEVALDIQIAAAAYFLATGKPAEIRVYWSKDITSAIAAAITGPPEAQCDVCSISWGSDEADWGDVAAYALQAQALEATEAGMFVFAASGDNDSSDGGSTPANVDLPASAPNVIGCGGTSKPFGGGPEVVWNNNPGNADGEGTGGGYSTLFKPQPWWKPGCPPAPAGLGRMVPDVAANADPNTGYQIFCHGVEVVIGGTSAVAPLYAGLIASCGRKLKFVSYAFWHNKYVFNDITSGNNGTYAAQIGPDPCTGLGSPNATRISSLMARCNPPAPTSPSPGSAPTRFTGRLRERSR